MRYPDSHKAETHRRIVEQAAAAFRKHGLEGIGVADLMKQAGLTHGGFYAHFKSRDALVAEALGAACAQTLEALSRAVETLPPERRRAAAVRQYMSEAHRDNPGAGCALAALGTEAARLKPAQRERLDEHLEAVVSLLQRGEDRPEALRRFSEMVGAMVLARAVRSKALSDEILAATREGDQAT
ncbi:MAG: TetR/AcrR family transcriptional regulator [Nevskiaceae bacterium]|nr:MAG: TetR/AcrR family transcriptional regulator [Nevskiaceae bacterium]TAM33875.1 MAG: TetR/AcrR family transcriptional regulator [Nevskiaceae bacterium]